MFKIYEVGESLQWHSQHKSIDGKIRHPVDSVAWELIDKKWPEFAMDSRNLRLGLATDSFNPFFNQRDGVLSPQIGHAIYLLWCIQQDFHMQENHL